MGARPIDRLFWCCCCAYHLDTLVFMHHDMMTMEWKCLTCDCTVSEEGLERFIALTVSTS